MSEEKREESQVPQAIEAALAEIEGEPDEAEAETVTVAPPTPNVTVGELIISAILNRL